jgi:hypothetical protein
MSLKKKTENRKAKQVLSLGWHKLEWEEDIRKRCRIVNRMKQYVHMYVNGKMFNFSRNWGGRIKNKRGVNSTMIYYKIFINVTVHSQYNNKK